ncbi:hypothetical protein ACKFKG_04530 [Phormidesmis sp. 146-35]
MENLHTCSQEAWLSEPTTIDNTWANYGEKAVGWLERSTHPRAQAARQFLRENLAKIPSEYRSHFIQALRTRWDSAFLEFILARTIQELGGEFALEQENSSGSCPDFLVNFSGHQLVIEVVSPSFDGEGDDERIKDAPLLEFINKYAPRDWSIAIFQLPKIGPQDSKKNFKEAFQQACKSLPADPEKKWYYVNHPVQYGQLHLGFFPEKSGHEAIVCGKTYPFGDAKDRIQQAVKRKRKQVRAEALPVLLAIHGSGYGVTFYDFDRALFGEGFTIVGGDDSVEKIQFKPNGLFLESGKEGKSPTYAGVLAFKRIDTRRKSDPVIYHHPRFTGELPMQLMNFEQRRFQSPNKINIQHAKCQNILAGLYFILNHL